MSSLNGNVVAAHHIHNNSVNYGSSANLIQDITENKDMILAQSPVRSNNKKSGRSLHKVKTGKYQEDGGRGLPTDDDKHNKSQDIEDTSIEINQPGSIIKKKNSIQIAETHLDS